MEPVGDNIIEVIHEGLKRYWNSAAEQFQEYLEHPAVDPRTEEEVEIEDQLLRAALAQATVSVPEMFRRSHRQLGPKFGAMERLQSRVSAHAAYMEHILRKKAIEDEEKEAYKAILRNKTIPPYFQSVTGESFLRVLGAMESAIMEVEEKNAEIEGVARGVIDDIIDNDVAEAEEIVGDIMLDAVKSVHIQEIIEEEPEIIEEEPDSITD